MPKSPANPRQLLLVKQLFDEAKRYAAVGGRLASMKALLLLDLSVEQMLNAVISDFSSEELLNLDDANWQTLWTKASAAAKNGELARLPNSRPLQKLHKLRNCVVHHGVAPDPGDVSTAVPAVEGMLSSCFSTLYGANLDTYRLLDEILNPGLRKLLRDAEEALVIGEPTWSLAASHVAFRNIVWAIDRALRDRQSHFGHQYDLPIERSDPPEIRRVAAEASARMSQLGKALQQREDELFKQVVIGNLGVAAADTGRFQQTNRYLVVHEMADLRTWTIYARGGRDSEIEAEARFAIDYVASLALLAQEAHPTALQRLQLHASLSDQDFWLQKKPGRGNPG